MAVVAKAPGSGHSRFSTLDAMRGVAALFVVARHIGPYVPRFSYLSVDVFFVLSGFVLAYANDDRFSQGMSPLTFLKARVVRLYPLYALGVVLGLISALVANPAALTTGQIFSTAAFEAFGLPGLTLFPTHAPFPINGVLWSIFFEFWVANVAFAFLWKRLHGAWLYALIAICGLSLVVCMKLYYSLDFGFEWSTLLPGCARVGFSFSLGSHYAGYAKQGFPASEFQAWSYYSY